MTEEERALIEAVPERVAWLRQTVGFHSEEIRRFGLERILEDLVERFILSAAEAAWIREDQSKTAVEVEGVVVAETRRVELPPARGFDNEYGSFYPGSDEPD